MDVIVSTIFLLALSICFIICAQVSVIFQDICSLIIGDMNVILGHNPCCSNSGPARRLDDILQLF